MQSTTIPTIGTVDRRPARQEPESTVNRGGVRDGAAAPKSDVGGGVPVSIQYLSVGAEVAATRAGAVHASCAAVCLAGVSRINCFNPSADELCLVSQQSAEHADGNLMEGVVVPGALLAFLIGGSAVLFLFLGFALVARCVLLDILQVLHNEDGSVGRVKELLDGTVAHILAHAGFLPGLLLQSALRGLRAFALELAFEVSHLATLAKVVLIDKGRAVAHHEQAAHTEVDTYGMVAALLCNGNLKWYGEPQVAATHEDERVAGLAALEHFTQLGIGCEGEMVALALCAASDIQPLHVQPCIEAGIEAHGEVVLLSVLGLPLLLVATDGAKGTAGVAAHADNHLRGQHREVSAQPVVAGMMHSHGIQRHVILLNEPDAGIIRPCSLGKQTQPVVLHLGRSDGADVVCQRGFAVFVLLHGCVLFPSGSDRVQRSALLQQLLHQQSKALRVVYAHRESPLAHSKKHGAVGVVGAVAVIVKLQLRKPVRVHVWERVQILLLATCDVYHLAERGNEDLELVGAHAVALVAETDVDASLIPFLLLIEDDLNTWEHFPVPAEENQLVLPLFLVSLGCHNTLILTKMGQHGVLSWLKVQSHRGITATRHDYCPNGFTFHSMADTKIAALRRHPFVPHFNFDAAKVGRKFEPRKRLRQKFNKICYITQKDITLNLKKEATFLHAAEDRVVSWREIL